MPRLAYGSIALLITSLPLGCGGGARTCPTTPTTAPTPRPATPPTPVVAKAMEFEDAACACDTAACATAVRDRMNDWTEANRDELTAALDDKLRALQIEAHANHLGSCLDALLEAEDDGAPASADPGPVDAVIAQAQVLLEELCECTDASCADAVGKRIDALTIPSTPPTPSQAEHIQQLVERMTSCRLSAAKPPTPLPPDPKGLIRPPVAADLPGYLKRVKGKGTLTATIETNVGTLHCALYERETPMTVANFVGLATGAKPWRDADGTVRERTPFYDGLRFHRVIPDFMIQGGDPLDSGKGGPGYAFANEIVATLHHDAVGVLSMANAGPDTNGSQFFITAKPTPWLDDKHTVFGKCAEAEVVAKITALAGDDDRPTRPVTMKKVTISRR